MTKAPKVDAEEEKREPVDPARVSGGYGGLHKARADVTGDDELADRHDAVRGLVGGETATTTKRRVREDRPLFDRIQDIRGRSGWDR